MAETINMVQAINLALHQEMKRDPNVIVLGEDVGIDGGVFRVTDGLLKQFGAQRVIDTPLAELGIVGTSVGMAITGMKPVAEIQFSGFAYGAFDQLISHASRIRNRTRGNLSCPMVLRMPYGGGIRALEHHSESMEAIYAHTPGLKVVMPSSPYEAKGLLTAAIRDPDPVIYMEPKRLYRAVKEKVPEKDYLIPLGKANIVNEGSDVTIISWGSMMLTTLQAFQQFSSKISIEIIDLRTPYPIDMETILNSVKKTGRCIIVHEAPQTCGVGAEIAAQIVDKALLNLKAPVKRVTGYDTIFPLYKLENDYLPSVKRIGAALAEVLKY
jgi:pyruvate dehydrogenase E1 component beta subunit